MLYVAAMPEYCVPAATDEFAPTDGAPLGSGEAPVTAFVPGEITLPLRYLTCPSASRKLDCALWSPVVVVGAGQFDAYDEL
jgi:hypothetical protein